MWEREGDVIRKVFLVFLDGVFLGGRRCCLFFWGVGRIEPMFDGGFERIFFGCVGWGEGEKVSSSSSLFPD